MAAQGEREADAALGAVSVPSISVTGALEAYWPLARDKLEGKTEDQVRKFENPRKLAVRMFVDAVGDLELDKITPDDLLTFRDTLLDKVAESEKFSAGSANKVISNLSSKFLSENGLIEVKADGRRVTACVTASRIA